MKFEFPVKFHRFTSAEFDRMKARHVAKHGYTMHIPGFSDIIKFNTKPPPTEQEIYDYKRKAWRTLGLERYREIQKHMAKKKESFMRMMDSPTPTWINNIGTSMTLMDDVNDSLGTLSLVCRTLARMLPKAAARAFMGPAGWCLLGADIMNLGMSVMRSPLAALGGKSDLSKASTTNPFCKEAKVMRARRMRSIKPTKGEIIEGLQTTNNVFGIGLSLGPIVGAVIEAFTGPFRRLQGSRVRVKWPIPKLSQLEFRAMEGVHASQQLLTGGQEMSDEDHTKCYLVTEMASQIIHPLFEEYHPLDHIEGMENIILTPPAVRDPSTRLLFDQEGIDPSSRVGFLHTRERQASVGELMDVGTDRNTETFDEYAQNTKHTILGQLGGQAANNSTENMLALWEGDDQVGIDLHPCLKACMQIMENRLVFHEDTSPQQLKCFSDLITYPPPHGVNPGFRTIHDSICPACNIRLVPRPAYEASP